MRWNKSGILDHMCRLWVFAISGTCNVVGCVELSRGVKYVDLNSIKLTLRPEDVTVIRARATMMKKVHAQGKGYTLNRTDWCVIAHLARKSW